MSSKKQSVSIHESKLFLETCMETEVKYRKGSQQSDITWLIKKQEKLKKDLAFWNSMVQGKLESLSSCINLFIMLILLSIGSEAYNGKGTNGPQVLGWICVAQVAFFYVVIICLKCTLIPSIEADLQDNNSEGFKLYNKILSHKAKLQDVELSQLELIQSIAKSKVQSFVKCFPHNLPDSVISQIKNVINSRSDQPYQPNNALKALKQRQKDAKWWQSFWQNFVLGKTFTVPGTMLLVLILTTLSIAQAKVTSKAVSNGQAWIATGLIVVGLLLFVIIKLYIWDDVNQKVENSRCDLLQVYRLVSLKHQSLKKLSLTQLQGLKVVLENRREDFKSCFPEDKANEVLAQIKYLIRERLPNKDDKNEETELKEIIQTEKYYQSLSAAWTAFFNQRLITTIINVLKFIVLIAITFVPNYSSNVEEQRNAKIVVGSIGIACLVFGYQFYFYLRAYYLDSLEAKAHSKRSTPFTTFRLVYFGNKKLRDLQPHQIEDICEGFAKRKDEFLKVFPNVDAHVLHRQLHEAVKQKLQHHYDSGDNVVELLKKQAQAKKMLSFWIGYADNPLMSSMYSVYVLLVLLVVTITSLYDRASQIVGWIGVATISLLIVLVFIIKVFVIDYKTNSVKALYVPGYSDYNLVYTKAKELSNIQVKQLSLILNVIQQNPIQFKRCFPKSNISKVADQIKLLLKEKELHHHENKLKYTADQVKSQKLTLQITRCKNALAAWTSLIMDKIYAIMQLAIVSHILWVQSIATTIYGFNVCAYVCIASLVIIAFLVMFFNCYYREQLQRKIGQCQYELNHLERKEHSNLSV